MRILYVIDGLKIGGAEMLLIDLLRAVGRQGHETAVAYFSPGPLRRELEVLDVPALRLSRHGLVDPRALFRLLGLVRRWRPHVVHTHLTKSDLTGQLAAAMGRVPVRVSSAHNTDPWRRRAVLTHINRLVMGRCQQVIAVSQEVHDYLVSVCAYPPEKIVTVENGIDLQRFDPQGQQPMDRTAAWGLGDEHPVIGVVGRLEPQKGHSVLLEAAARVAAEVPETRFVVIGDGPLRSALEAQRGRLGLDGHVTFTGVLRDIPAALAALDVVAFPSLWEGLPVALLEAMAMERPIVATAVGGMAGVLHDGVTGVLVAAGEPDELARGLLRLLRDPVLARRLGTQARDFVREHHSMQAMHRRILGLYRSPAS